MSYKIILLAPSAGGKSTLMRYLRQHTKLNVAEIDEEIVKANNGAWPADDYINEVLIPQITNAIISKTEIIYLAKDMPDYLLRKAKGKGFRIIVIKLTLRQLNERNIKRMKEEGYKDASPWFKGQLEHLDHLSDIGLVDGYIDGNLPTAEIAKDLQDWAKEKE